jgi:hypothetical protein
MNYYFVKKNVLYDGTIELEKIIYDSDKFEIIEKDNKILLVQKIKIIKITTLDSITLDIKDFRHSKIVSCLINGKRPLDNKYNSILKDIYYLIKKGTIIIKNTILNIETIHKNDKGFKYLDNIGISYQGVESGLTFKEIITQCVKNNIRLDIDILFESSEQIKFIL